MPPQTQMSGWTKSRHWAFSSGRNSCACKLHSPLRQRDLDVFGELLHGVDDFLGVIGLFEPHGIVGLDLFGHADGARHLEELGMNVDADVDIRSYASRTARTRWPADARDVVHRAGIGVRHVGRHFDGGVAVLLDEPLGGLRDLLRLRCRRRFDRRGSCRALCLRATCRRAARPPCRRCPSRACSMPLRAEFITLPPGSGEVVHQVPEVLDVAWVLADEPRFVVFDDFDVASSGPQE